MKKPIGLAVLVLSISSQSIFAASVEQTHQAVAKIMEGAGQAQAAEKAVPVPAQDGPSVLLDFKLEPVELQSSLTNPKLLPTLHAYGREDQAAHVVLGVGSFGAVIGAVAGWITASHHLAATVALGAWTGMGIGLAAGLLVVLAGMIVNSIW